MKGIISVEMIMYHAKIWNDRCSGVYVDTSKRGGFYRNGLRNKLGLWMLKIMTMHWLTPCLPYTTVHWFIVHSFWLGYCFRYKKKEMHFRRFWWLFKVQHKKLSVCWKWQNSGICITEVENALKEVRKSF